jgi:hypothetical protein
MSESITVLGTTCRPVSETEWRGIARDGMRIYLGRISGLGLWTLIATRTLRFDDTEALHAEVTHSVTVMDAPSLEAAEARARELMAAHLPEVSP